MDQSFFRKFADIITEAEAEEKQLFTLVSDAGKRQLNATPTRAKELARNLMMQQQLGSWFKLEDGEGNTVLKHGKGPETDADAQPASHSPNIQTNPDAEIEAPAGEEDKMSFYDYLNQAEQEHGLSHDDVEDALDRLKNPRLSDQGNVIDGDYEVVDEPKQISAEGKFEAPNKPKFDYSKQSTPTGDRQFREPRKPNGVMSKSEKLGKDGMVYHWQDPRAN